MEKAPLATLTRKALLALAKERGLTGVSRLRKAALLARLQHEQPVAPRHAVPSAADSSASRSSAKKRKPPAQRKPPTPLSSATVVSPREAGVSTLEQPAAPPPLHVITQPQSPTSDERQAAAESKFFLGPQPSAPVAEPEGLPASYNDNRIVLLARDPYWLYAYWDFSGAHLSAVQSQLTDSSPRLVLRIFDVTYLEFNGRNAWNITDIELTPFATNWYFSVPQAEAAYCVEIGYHSSDGHFASLGRSNVVTTPRAAASLSTTVRWFTPPERREAARSMELTPRSTFTHDMEPNEIDGDAAWPSSPATEHPFSWGANHKLPPAPLGDKEHE